MSPNRITSRNDKSDQQIAFLKQTPLFADLTTSALQTLLADFTPRVYRRDELIFRQGDKSHEVYLVQKGKLRVYKVSPSGGETSINIFFPTDVVGEFAAVDDQPRSASAKAIGACHLLVMSQTKFLHHLRTMPDLALSLARLLTNKLRWTAAYAETIAQYDAAGRLLHILLSYNDQFGEIQEEGKRYVLNLALNQTDLASLIGTRREWVNRLLQDWRKRGLIEYDSGKIIILDLPSVEAERDSRIEANVARW
ncbi:MAG: Crp/Fnr family transcriptional regulator [Anaerolineaceae bacterium]|nr:Crp/Fnr family transcriptional regulator [Anaerolineaceae bacterium]